MLTDNAAERLAPWGSAAPVLPILVAVCVYLPTLHQPFDFEDDGMLVYYSAQSDASFVARLGLIRDRTLVELGQLATALSSPTAIAPAQQGYRR